MNILFSEQLNKLRIAKNLSQDDIAQKLFVPRDAVNRWESGESTPDLDNLVKLSKLLNCSLDELVLGNKEDEHPYYGKMNFWDFAARYWWLLFAIAGFIVWMISYLR
ncbi:helix-turn-helix domain-containing protein [Lentilactobacillus sp. SPB1-3]|uniref:Helix-turn-helix domain-containing protein n=1 Tax=Lentilactobacillus terminaliae TaxID=3003483 RepID=A0ACD5DC86_9LACO|nr:helix-turn-helix transcriptional regulator [Lentilactobacillus sp. SPB1-3]MCZ0977130.1 helix-turn-helix transcriptional regulator [Lentilactobacillus sp. SPB1-3]